MATAQEHYVNAFRSDFDLLYQQRESRLFATVRTEGQDVEADFYNILGSTELDPIGTRIGDTPLEEIEHLRRMLILQDFDKGIPLTKQDIEKMGPYDPSDGYVQTLTGAAGRRIDKQILKALGGPVYTGKAGATTVQNYAAGECRLMAGDGTWVTAGSDHSNTTATALTVGKLAKLKVMLDNAKVPADERYFALDSYQISALLQDTTYGGPEYMTVRDIQQGEMRKFFGFQFIIMPDDIFTVNETETDCIQTYAYHRRAVVCATGTGSYSPEIRIGERPDKRYLTQFYCKLYCDATRLQGPGVIEVNLLKAA